MEINMPVKLKEWAESMSYVDVANGSSDFAKLCKNPKIAVFWSNVISKIRPKEELDHIRKNIILHRMKKSTSNKRISGVLGQQLQSHQELKQLKLQKEKTLEGVIHCENSIKETQNNLCKKALRERLLENVIHDAQIKQHMFKLKKKNCDSFLLWLQEVNALAKSHFSQSTGNSEEEERHATEILKKCTSAVKEFQLWKRGVENTDCNENQEDFQSNYELRKTNLWHAISAFVAKIPPDYLWTAIFDQVKECVAEMGSLAWQVDVKSINEIMREGLPFSHDEMSEMGRSQQTNMKLLAMHIKALGDVMENLVKAEQLTHRLETLIEMTVDDIEIRKTSADANSTFVKMPSRKFMEYLREHCRTIQLKVTKKFLHEGIVEIRNKSGNLFSFQNLKQGKAAVARLDNEIEEAKMYVEQLFKSVKDTARTLRNIQKSVEEELEKFSKNRAVANDSESGSSGDSRTAVNSFVASTPAALTARKAPDSSSFCDMSTILCDSGVGDCITFVDKNFSNLREAVPALKKAISQESKTFIKLPLDLASKNRLHSPVLFSSHLESPSVIARTSKRFAQLMQLLHGVDESQVYLSVFRNLGHLRAARIQQLFGEVLRPAPLCADVSLQYLKVTAPELYYVWRDRLKDVKVVLESTEDMLEESRKNQDTWIEQPLQNLIPTNIQFHGMNFEQWMKNYNSCVVQLP